jgi:hypothetical protein
MCAGKTSDLVIPSEDGYSTVPVEVEESHTYQNTSTHPHHENNHCPNEFETSYAPERKEIVYCEQCYNAEVA